MFTSTQYRNRSNSSYLSPVKLLWRSVFVFRRSLVWISAGSPAILTEDFLYFCQSLQANTMVVTLLGHGHFPPNSVQFIIHQSSCHSAKSSNKSQKNIFIKLHFVSRNSRYAYKTCLCSFWVYSNWTTQEFTSSCTHHKRSHLTVTLTTVSLLLDITLPVVHEDIRSPNFVGSYSEILDSPKFGFVPPEVVVVPLLRGTHQDSLLQHGPHIYNSSLLPFGTNSA